MAWHYVTTDRPGWTSPYSQDQKDNVIEIWNLLYSNGWTENACSAVCGNFQVESYLNPGQWELYQNYSMTYGMGLGQWTPATKVSDFIGSTNHDDMASGASQIELLLSAPGQYSTHYLNPDGTSTYYGESGLPYISSMADFSQSTESIEKLTKLWAICWERPVATYYQTSINDRINHAAYWFDVIHGVIPSRIDKKFVILMKQKRRKELY